MSEIIFDEETILEASRQAAGLSDFGPEHFRDGLRKLIATYDRAGFHERGRKRNHRRRVLVLSTRRRSLAARVLAR